MSSALSHVIYRRNISALWCLHTKHWRRSFLCEHADDCRRLSHDARFVFLCQLIQTNKLKHYPSIHGDFSSEFRQPCVVFTGHPSLRFGDVVHFMELWGKSSLNTIIFTGTCSRSTGALPSCSARHVVFSSPRHQSQIFLTWMHWLPTSRWL